MRLFNFQEIKMFLVLKKRERRKYLLKEVLGTAETQFGSALL